MIVVGTVGVTGVTADDFHLSGGFACSTGALGLAFFVDTLVDAVGSVVQDQANQLCVAPKPQLITVCP